MRFKAIAFIKKLNKHFFKQILACWLIKMQTHSPYCRWLPILQNTCTLQGLFFGYNNGVVGVLPTKYIANLTVLQNGKPSAIGQFNFTAIRIIRDKSNSHRLHFRKIKVHHHIFLRFIISLVKTHIFACGLNVNAIGNGLHRALPFFVLNVVAAQG